MRALISWVILTSMVILLMLFMFVRVEKDHGLAPWNVEHHGLIVFYPKFSFRNSWKMAVFSTLKGTLSWIRLGAREAGTMTSQAVRKHPGASLSAATTIFGLFTATYVSFMILIVFFYIENYPSLFIICLCRYIIYSNRPLSAIDQLDECECLFRESEKQMFKAMLREPKLWVIAVSGPPDAGLWTSSHLLLSFSLHKKKRFMRTAFFRSCSLSVPV